MALNISRMVAQMLQEKLQLAESFREHSSHASSVLIIRDTHYKHNMHSRQMKEAIKLKNIAL